MGGVRGRGERGEGGDGGGGGWLGFSSILYTPQQLSALHFISQIIKDDYHLPF